MSHLLSRQRRCCWSVLLLLAAAAACPAAAFAAAPLQFRTPPTFAVGAGAMQIVTGDFNGDGLLDFATANFYDSTVGVCLGLGQGRYASLTPISVSPESSPDALAVGDVNGDGKLDLVVANANGWSQPGSLLVLLGNGDGTFAVRTTIPVGTGPRGVVIADFNTDGKLDIATAVSGGWFPGNTVDVSFGNGDGTFSLPTSFTAVNDPVSIDVGDFNKDGRPDLVVVSGNGSSASILLNVGGPFGDRRTVDVGANSVYVVVRDFDGDGNPDFAVGSVSGLTMVRGRGDGSFNVASNYPIAGGLGQFAVADFNHDGIPDVAALTGGYDNTLAVFRGTGGGAFAAPVSYQVSASLRAIAAGDFLGDTNLDLAVTSDWDSNVTVVPGNSDGTFNTVIDTYATGGLMHGMIAEDLNRDGQLDIVTVNPAAGSISVLLQQTNGTFNPAMSYAVGSMPYAVRAGDFNNDGVPDLVVANFDGTVQVLPGSPTRPGIFTNQSGAFGIGPQMLPGTHWDVAVGFFNADSNLDLVTANYYEGTLTVALGDGTGHFQTNYQMVTSAPGATSLAIADFNGDGKTDIALGYQGGVFISIYPGRGDGTFDPLVDVYAFDIPGSIAAADLNGDGKPDLVAALDDTSYVSVMLNASTNGLVRFWSPQTYRVPVQTTSVAIGDFNGDSVPDLVFGSYSTVEVMLGNGDGTFQPAASYVGGGRYLAVGDFNNDSVPDILIDLDARVGILWNDSLPALQIRGAAAGAVRLAWPAWSGYKLEASTNLTISNGWFEVVEPRARLGNQFVLTNAAPGAGQWYRLKRPSSSLKLISR